MRADGTHQRKVSVVKPTVSRAQISPDGRKVLLGLYDGDVLDPERIIVLDLSTGKKREVSDWSSGFARWSPDGRRIAYTAPARVDGTNGFALFSIRRDLEGRRRRILGSRHSFGVFDW
jgi:Tol biopolymer transport system component